MTRPDFATGCPTGKRAYYSRAAAKTVTKTRRHEIGRQRPYRCGECGGWHTGHLNYATMRGAG